MCKAAPMFKSITVAAGCSSRVKCLRRASTSCSVALISTRRKTRAGATLRSSSTASLAARRSADAPPAKQTLHRSMSTPGAMLRSARQASRTLSRPPENRIISGSPSGRPLQRSATAHSRACSTSCACAALGHRRYGHSACRWPLAQSWWHTKGRPVANNGSEYTPGGSSSQPDTASASKGTVDASSMRASAAVGLRMSRLRLTTGVS